MCAGVIQLNNTPSATSPASIDIFGPSAPTTTIASISACRAATPVRTRASELLLLPLPTPRTSRSSGRASDRKRCVMTAGGRASSGMTPTPIVMWLVAAATAASDCKPSASAMSFTQNDV